MEKKGILILILGLILWGCREPNTEIILEKKVKSYFSAWNKHDFHHPDYAKFKRDTSYTWHGTKNGKGIQSIYDPNSGWKQWDIAWNGSYMYDIVEINVDSMIVVGEFRETTDFLKTIGMPEGFSATVIFWFDDRFRVKETLYAWSSDNRKIDDVLKPILEWAKVNDSTSVENIYLKDGFVPNTENAEIWKNLLDSYKMEMGNDKISTIDFVQILDGNKQEAVYYYQNNWRVLRNMAIKKEYIHSYQVLEVPPSESEPFQLMLITTYVNNQQYELREEHFTALIKEKGGLKLMNDKEPAEFRRTLFSKNVIKHWN